MAKNKTLLEKMQSADFPSDEATLIILGFCKGRLSGAGCEGCPARTDFSENGQCTFIGASSETIRSISAKILKGDF